MFQPTNFITNSLLPATCFPSSVYSLLDMWIDGNHAVIEIRVITDLCKRGLVLAV